MSYAKSRSNVRPELRNKKNVIKDETAQNEMGNEEEDDDVFEIFLS